MLLKDLTDELNFIQKQIWLFREKLDGMEAPAGRLSVNQNGCYTKWYLKEENSTKYIPKSQRDLAKSAAQSAYFREMLAALEREQRTVERLIFAVKNAEGVNEKYASAKYADLMGDYRYSASKRLTVDGTGAGGLQMENQDFDPAAWAGADYPTNPYKPENRIHGTLCGRKMRSKSEAKIADALFRRGLYFRYEDRLIINGLEKYPDFTILSHDFKKVIYWEHLGMMDDVKYRNRNLTKIGEYIEEGIMPGDNLILTFETDDKGLDSIFVEQMIDMYFGKK